MARYRGGRWRPYVKVATRKARAARYASAFGGPNAQPVVIEGRQIAQTFWGRAWCEHLEQFSDYENRLPRGRSYVRNGSVCHLEIAAGQVRAVVIGRQMYDVAIDIDPLAATSWADLKRRCAGRIGSLLELLQGRLSDRVMAEVCNPERGLFPLPKQIHLTCSCPDWAVMCKHVAAVLYGVGARLDEEPALLFVLRGVDQEELVDAEAGVAAATTAPAGGHRRIAEEDLGEIFGIDMSQAPAPDTGGPDVEVDRGEDEKAARDPRARFGPLSGYEVASLRKGFGMTQSEFALLLGVTGATISNWERATSLRVLPRVRAIWVDAAALTPDEAWLCLEVLER